MRGRLYDGNTIGRWIASLPVVIRNAAPGAPSSVTISPAEPTSGEALQALAKGAQDPDGDSVFYHFQWYMSPDGGTTWQAETYRQLPAGVTTSGEWWKVAAQADDGTVSGPWAYSTPVTVAGAAAASLCATATTAATPGGLVQIMVDLSSAAQVQVTVRNLAGRIVSVLPAQALPKGLHSLLWNGRCRSGTQAPAGEYLLELVAEGAGGGTARCLAPLRR